MGLEVMVVFFFVVVVYCFIFPYKTIEILYEKVAPDLLPHQ